MKPTEKDYLEADKWLAEQIGECVHDWESKISTHKCTKCPKVFKQYSGYLQAPPVCTPRSKDLGAMFDIVSKLRFLVTKFYTTPDGRVLITIRKILYDSFGNMYTQIMTIKDFPLPQYAMAWGLYLVLREVKK